MTAVLPLLAAGCGHWVPATVPAPVVVAERPGARLRIDPCAGERFELYKTQLAGDTLVGNLPGRMPVERRFPADSVCALAVRKTSAGRTVLLGVGLGLIVALVVSLDDIAKGALTSGGY